MKHLLLEKNASSFSIENFEKNHILHHTPNLLVQRNVFHHIDYPIGDVFQISYTKKPRRNT